MELPQLTGAQQEELLKGTKYDHFSVLDDPVMDEARLNAARAILLSRELESTKAENERLKEMVDVAMEGLGNLSCLGNGNIPGNSDGNKIAQRTITRIIEISDRATLTNEKEPK